MRYHREQYEINAHCAGSIVLDQSRLILATGVLAALLFWLFDAALDCGRAGGTGDALSGLLSRNASDYDFYHRPIVAALIVGAALILSRFSARLKQRADRGKFENGDGGFFFSAKDPGIIEIGPAAAMRFPVEQFSGHSEVECRIVHFDETGVLFSCRVPTAVFRYLRECLGTISGHPAKTDISLTLRGRNDESPCVHFTLPLCLKGPDDAPI